MTWYCFRILGPQRYRGKGRKSGRSAYKSAKNAASVVAIGARRNMRLRLRDVCVTLYTGRDAYA